MAPQQRQSFDRWSTRALVTALGGACAAASMYLVICVWHRYARMNDFRAEAWPAYRALEHWHLLQFVRLSPAYVGSLVMRAPFLPLAGVFGGGWKGAYFATALPCIVAPPLIGIWLSTMPRARVGSGVASRISPLVLYAANPIAIVCLGFGHAEDVLGAALCVGATVLAVRGSVGWSGVLTGLAVANKPWALVLVPVVLAVLPAGRARCAAVMAGTAAAILVPIFAVREVSLSAGSAAASFGSQTGHLFLIPQLLYWAGPSSWLVQHAHVLIVVVAFACAGTWWALRGRSLPRTPEPTEALLLLMLVLFLRAALDPWDNLYYQTPFLFALMAYEARRTPWLTALFSVALLLLVPPSVLGGTRDLAAARYTALAVPTITLLGLRVFLGPTALAPLRSIPRLRRRASYGM